MRQITDILASTGGLAAMARELGLSESQAAAGAAALAPAILGGLKKQAQSQGGLASLAGMLSQLGGGALLDDVVANQPTHLDRGNEVLGRIFGSKEVSRTVAQSAAARTGLSTDVLKQMLPMLAMAVSGYMAKQGGAAAAASGGGLTGMLSGLLGGKRGGAQQASSAGGLLSMLDLDGDGNPLDDILRLAGKAFR